MGIRSEKRKVLQQIVNKEDSSLDIDPESLMCTGDLHWFDAVSKKPATEEKKEDNTSDKSNPPPLPE